jgi:hypothetical protein
MSRLLVRLLAAVLVCEGVVLSLLAAAFFIFERVVRWPELRPERRSGGAGVLAARVGELGGVALRVAETQGAQQPRP